VINLRPETVVAGAANVSDHQRTTYEIGNYVLARRLISIFRQLFPAEKAIIEK